MKKIAILLVGGLKQFTRRSEYDSESFSDSWKRVAKYYDADVFAYVDNNDFFYENVQYFSDENSDMKVCNGNANRLHTNVKHISYEESKPMIENILKETFNNRLKDMVIDEYHHNPESYCNTELTLIHKKYYPEFFNNTTYSSVPQFYKWKQCFRLMESYEESNDIEYDIVIKTRPDVKLLNVFDVDIRELDFNKKIYCSSHIYHMSDFWAIGNKYTMGIYCSYIDNIGINFKYNKYMYLYMKNGRVFDYQIEDNPYPTKYKIQDDITYSNASGCEFQLMFLLSMVHNIQLISRIIICKCSRFYPGDKYVDVF